MTGASNIDTDLVSSNQITDYSFAKLNKFKEILRCVSGLGASTASANTLGGWYFNGTKIPVGNNCGGPVFKAHEVNSGRHPGVINLILCETFTITEEGVYSCIMMNSSMMNQTMRVGVYFRGRSESVDMYSITSLLTILHLSTQLLQ